MMTTCKHIRQSKDCSLEFVSQLVGKLCLCGYAGNSTCVIKALQRVKKIKLEWFGKVQNICDTTVTEITVL